LQQFLLQQQQYAMVGWVMPQTEQLAL